jgi:hypothetical protein
MFDLVSISLYRGIAGHSIFRDIAEHVSLAIRTLDTVRSFIAATTHLVIGYRLVGFRAVLGSGGNGASGAKNTMLLFRHDVSRHVAAMHDTHEP